MVRWIFATIVCASVPLSCPGVPAATEVAELSQPDGTRLRAKLVGDEWFNWNETEDGYVIGKDTDGRWKYRRPRKDRAGFDFVPGAVVGKVNPASLNLRKRDLPAARLIRERVENLRGASLPVPRILAPAPSSPSSPAGTSSAQAGSTTSTSSDVPPPAPADAAPSATSPAAENLRCVVILAAFDDHWDAGTHSPVSSRGRPRSSYHALFNQPGHSADGAAGSARDYFREVSYGRTDITFVVSDWVRLPQTEAYYGDNANEVAGAARARVMAAHAVAAADTAGFDFTAGDGDNDGWVDMLVVIYSGYSEAHPGNPSTNLWPRQWTLPVMETRDGKNMHAFATTSAMRGLQSSATGIMRIGTLVHEIGHLFGLPDLYDTGGLTKGIGAWGLMAYGGWGASGSAATEHRPTHMEAFSKMLLGYVDPRPVHSHDEHALSRLAVSPDAHLWRGSAGDTEYFLVENRGGTGFDADLPPGLLITHIDAGVLTAANNYAAFPTPAIRVEEAGGGDTLCTFGGATSDHVWSASHGLPGGFRDDTGHPDTNAMRYQTSGDGPHPHSRANNPAFHTGIVADGFSATAPVMTYRLRTRVPMIDATAATSGGYTISWSPAFGATRYELQEGSATTSAEFFDGAESLAFLREHWQVIGAVAPSSLANATPGGTSCYELAGTLPGPDGLANTADDHFMPDYRGLVLRTPFTLTASSVFSFKYLSQRAAGRGLMRVQLTADDGLTWTTLATYDGYVTSWTTSTFDFAQLQAAGFSAGDVCRLRFVMTTEQLYGWTNFPAYGYALDDIHLTGVSRDSTGWASLSNDVTTTSYAVSGKPDASSWRYRVRAFADGAWRDWSPVSNIDVAYSPLANWRWTHFEITENAGEAADGADPDHDGLANLVEYAVSSSPVVASPSARPVLHVAQSKLNLTFIRARAELTYIVQASSDLATWDDIAVNPGEVGTETTVTVADTVTLSEQPRRFLRLRVLH